MKISVVGSGNYGTAISRRLAININERNSTSQYYNPIINMYCYEEKCNNRNLSEIINTDHINHKYLPNIELPRNIVANPNLLAICDADIFIFVVPHQYIHSIIEQMKNNIKDTASCVILSKGLFFKSEGPELISNLIKDGLNINNIAVCSGANIANDVALDQFVESTIACNNEKFLLEMKELFQNKFFRIDTTLDVYSVELCGALKNIIAMGAGFCDGLDVGSSSKAAVIRRGIQELTKFCQLFSPTFDMNTIFSSCGIADVFASSIAGRNRKCSEQFVKEYQIHSEINKILFMNEESKESKEITIIEVMKNKWMNIEKNILNGQKMQGLSTLGELMQCINYININKTITKSSCDNKTNIKNIDVSTDHASKDFILFQRIYEISILGANPVTLFDW